MYRPEFDSVEQAYDALREFFDAAPIQRVHDAWRWACLEYECETPDLGQPTREMLRSTIMDIIELRCRLHPMASPAFEIEDMMDTVGWYPTAQHVSKGGAR